MTAKTGAMIARGFFDGLVLAGAAVVCLDWWTARPPSGLAVALVALPCLRRLAAAAARTAYR